MTGGQQQRFAGMRRCAVSAVLFVFLTACAAQGVAEAKRNDNQPIGLAGDCKAHFGQVDLTQQKAVVTIALQRLEQRQKSALTKLEQDASSSAAGPEEAHFDKLTSDYNEARKAILRPLVASGNAEAMVRLADSGLRESDDPGEIKQWFALTTCAADLGHPLALDELVRWSWHQRGDGSIAQVQANRATALAFANRAALAENMYAITRIATYVSGNVHQYPANLGLGQRLERLCAETGARICEENLAGSWSYDPGLSPVETYAWLSRAADDQPERFEKRRDFVWSKLSAEEREAAIRDIKTWRPRPWRDLQDEWKVIAADILAYGQTSTGFLPACDTAHPWCRTLARP